MSIGPLASSTGLIILYFLGSIMSWRHVSLICAFFPFITLAAVYFVRFFFLHVNETALQCSFIQHAFIHHIKNCITKPPHIPQIPESPLWLMSKNRPEEAKKSLQCLRGGVSVESIQKEFSELQTYSEASRACTPCAKQSIKCNHPKATFWERIKELTRKCTLKPFILIVSLQFFLEFSGIMVWMPYIIPVLKAHGIPLGANITTIILSAIGFFAHVCLLVSIKTAGKRRICLTSMVVVVLCCCGLSTIFSFLQ